MEKLNITVSYMHEAGWFDSPVYVVWLHGATDEWPQAIFNTKEGADFWVKIIHMNPEGFNIVEMSMFELSKQIYLTHGVKDEI